MCAYHIPVLLKKSVDGLDIKPDGIYIDVTFGGGGHSREILKRLTTGRLFGFDQDADAEANLIDDERFTFIRHNFCYLSNFLRYFKITKVDGILADLGVSSHDFDVEERGFSFRFDGKLDMRMNQNINITAADLLNKYETKYLYRIFRDYGEIKNPGKLTSLIENSRKQKEIQTVSQFKEIIAPCMPKFNKNKYLAKVFQALRIEVNQEMEALKEMLSQIPRILKQNGRLVVITYHSLEDRLVKNFIRSGKFQGSVEKDFYGNTLAPLEAVNRKVILPTDEEIKKNNRARSAKLRIAKRN